MNLTRCKYYLKTVFIRIVSVVIFLLLIPAGIYAQRSTRGPAFAIKTNAFYWVTLTPNMGIEIGLGKKTTIDITGGYNPFEFKNNKKLKHWLVQPELRWWLCERFNGHFFGIHVHGGYCNLGGVKLPFCMWPELKMHRYEGEFYGGGISYGYQWILGKRWNLDAEIGGGYVRFNYDKYQCPKCGEHRGSGSNNYFGVTKAAVSIIYVIK